MLEVWRAGHGHSDVHVISTYAEVLGGKHLGGWL
jgi:hypothetical protein